MSRRHWNGQGFFNDADLQAMLTAWKIAGRRRQQRHRPQGRRIKLSPVISQVDDSEIMVAEEKEILKCYGRYETVFGTGERPATECEPTAEQLLGADPSHHDGSATICRLQCLWPAWTLRMMKRIKLPRYNIERDGTLRTLELYGPNSLGTWLQSYNVLLAVLVMIDAVWWTLDTSKRTGRTLRGCQRDMVPKSGLSSIKQMSAADLNTWRGSRDLSRRSTMRPQQLATLQTMMTSDHGTSYGPGQSRMRPCGAKKSTNPAC